MKIAHIMEMFGKSKKPPKSRKVPVISKAIME